MAWRGFQRFFASPAIDLFVVPSHDKSHKERGKESQESRREREREPAAENGGRGRGKARSDEAGWKIKEEKGKDETNRMTEQGKMAHHHSPCSCACSVTPKRNGTNMLVPEVE